MLKNFLKNTTKNQVIFLFLKKFMLLNLNCKSKPRLIKLFFLINNKKRFKKPVLT